jgi:ATP-dependent Clp protease adaptor protein ClpS
LKHLTFSLFLLSNQAKVGKGGWVWYGTGNMTPSNATGQPGVIQIVETVTKSELSTPWNVIVHNDPVNLMTYVTMVLMRVFGYPRDKAKKMMLEVHNQGRSLVWSGGREQAEHYVHQLHGYQLLATMEKSET